METVDPIIVTARLDDRSFAFFDAMRKRHFPPELNFIPAHLTLFHHLPGASLMEIEASTEAMAKTANKVVLQVTGLKLLGRGVAYDIEAPELSRIQAVLRHGWGAWLTQQDQQAFRPHIVIQNKTDFEQARALCHELSAGFEPFTATATGLDLWHYRGGPWEAASHFAFS